MLIKLDESSIDTVVSIIESTKLTFKIEGIDQWQHGYPNKASIITDFQLGQGFLIWEANQVVGYLSLQTSPDPNYDSIDGTWHSSYPYATVHRFTISPDARRKGYARSAFLELESLVSPLHWIRVDTAFENKGMRNLLECIGYKECGSVYVSDGIRVCYDKYLP